MSYLLSLSGTLTVLGLLLAAPGCARTPSITWVDLTHPFDQQTVYWPHNQAFEWKKTDWGMTEKGFWYASAAFAASEHGGTHIDAPIHFGRDRQTVDQIPLDRLIGPAIVVDIRSACARNADYELSVADLQAWESSHGPVPSGSLVLVWTGWSHRWPDRQRYLGSLTPDHPLTLHFPGVSAEAAAWLIQRYAIRGMAIDTASIDPGRSRDFPTHRVLNEADVFAIENVASLEQLPPRGATVYALPIKIKGGTGGPTRIIAAVPTPPFPSSP
jgi:kynurenine formamidase